ncbi:MAG: peptidylprolyl isomerase [Bacteroides sp.]|nr:peptidylprolyl isomerase [Roseburia sp.]MCM1345779.1 peptidylprolyl isomerase [Bacteroides sp.]MCM1420126.1 peptidylprolyl isomerase [Bacteroides sp.]
MKKKNIIVAAFMLGINAMAQTTDPILMKINGKPITRSEFEYSFNKNNADGVLDKKEINDYVPLFVDFKLKVAAAEEAQIDTLPNIRKELRGYKEQMLLPTLVDSNYIEREAKKTYENTAARFAGADLLKASHILIFLRQDATAEQQTKAKERIDSIYTVLKNGADFTEVAKSCSEDRGSAQRGGELGEFGKGMMIPEFEAAAYSLKKGEMSEPIKTSVGYHIIKLTDRHPFESYEFHHEAIIKFLNSRGIKEASANALIDSLARTNGQTRDEVINDLTEKMQENDSDMKNLSQEYYDGTLMYEISKSQIWDKAAKDEQGLEKYFVTNKKKYAWKEPHFRGIIIHAKDEATLEAAKKSLKKIDEDKWATTLTSKFNNDSVKLVRIERGIYKQGENANIDHLVFKSGEGKPLKDFPVTGIYGNKAKKPLTYKDVRGQITTDYQNELERQWIEQLRKKYTVEIDESVLSTVNNH